MISTNINYELFSEKLRRMRKVVHDTEITDLGKPRLCCCSGEVEEVGCMLIDDVVLKPRDHSKDGKLLEMKNS